MCDNAHDDRIKQYGYCSLCKTTTPTKVEKPKNNKKSG